MLRQITTAAATLIALGMAGNAAAYTTDGYLDDWVKNDGSWNTVNGFSGLYVNDNSSSDYLNTIGGQNYDTELLMADVDWTAQTLYVAVVSGVPPTQGGTDDPDTSSSAYRPGDLAIYTGIGYDSNPTLLWDVNSGTLNWDSWEPSGSSTEIDDYMQLAEVYSVELPDPLTNPAETGNVYKGSWWHERQDHPTSIDYSDGGQWKGDYQGTAGVVYQEAKFSDGSLFAPTGGQGYNPIPPSSHSHYLIEAAIPLAALGLSGSTSFDIALHWTMNCSNDWIAGSGQFSRSGNNSVPEPAPLAIMALGLVGVGLVRRKASASS